MSDVFQLKPLLDTEMAAPLIGVSVGTAENWRIAGIGPKFIKCGRKVFYDPNDIAEWRNENRIESTRRGEQVRGGAVDARSWKLGYIAASGCCWADADDAFRASEIKADRRLGRRA